MRGKIRNVLLILVLALCISSFMQNVLFAAVYTFVPNPADLNDLDHWKAYRWGLRQQIADNETVTAAQFKIYNIDNWINEPDDVLHVRLLRDVRDGLKVFTDNQEDTDYFAPRGILLFDYTDTDEGTAEDLVYNFNAQQLRILETSIRDEGDVNTGTFGFGIDPDCHYWNDGVEFNFTTSVVPEPATLSLLGLGLLGLLRFRRKI